MFYFEDFKHSYNNKPVNRHTFDCEDFNRSKERFDTYSDIGRSSISYDDLTNDLYLEYDRSKDPVVLFRLAERLQLANSYFATRYLLMAYLELKKKKNNPKAKKFLMYLMSYMWKSFFGESLNRENKLYMDDFFDPQFIVKEILQELIALENDKEYSSYAKEAYVALAYCYAFGIVVKKDLKKAKECLNKGIIFHASKYDNKIELSSYIERGIASYSFIFNASKLKFLTDYKLANQHYSIIFEKPFTENQESFFHKAFNTEFARDYLNKLMLFHMRDEGFLSAIKDHWDLSKRELEYINGLEKSSKPSKGDLLFERLPLDYGEYSFRMATKEEMEKYGLAKRDVKTTFCVESKGKVLAYYSLSVTCSEGVEYILKASYFIGLDEQTKDFIDKLVFDHMNKNEFIITEFSSTLKYVTKPLHPYVAMREIARYENEKAIYGMDIDYILTYFQPQEENFVYDAMEVVYEF